MLVVDFGFQFLSIWDFSCGFSVWTLWGFLTAWWLDSKGKCPERDSETQRERDKRARGRKRRKPDPFQG